MRDAQAINPGLLGSRETGRLVGLTRFQPRLPGHLGFYVMAIFFSVFSFFPMFWIAISSLMPLKQITAQPLQYIP